MPNVDIAIEVVGVAEEGVVVNNPGVEVAIAGTVLPNSTNANRKVMGFSWGDASPLLIADVTGVITRVELIIIEPFDVPSAVTVGTSPDYTDIFPEMSELTLEMAAKYDRYPLTEVSEQVYLRIQPGVGCSSGSGLISLDWSVAS